MSSLSGLQQLLGRLQVSYKRARGYVRSPDPHYLEKLQSIRTTLAQVRTAEGSQVLLFADEFTLYRHPSLAAAYEQRGTRQPLARLGFSRNKVWRLVAGLNALTGQVTFSHGSHTSIPMLRRFYQHIVESYPQAQTIWIVEDNWPIHFHPDLLAAFQPQHFPFGYPRPGNWSSQARTTVARLDLPIHLLCLPSYASWTNPIEKLWRLLRQEVLHVHRYQDDWEGLRNAAVQFLQQFSQASGELLRYVGLAAPDLLYRTAFLPMKVEQTGGN